MSYILDALKKIEHEKNRKANPDGRISISGDLFRERKQPPSRGGIWKLLALIVAASLVTFAGTWFLLQGKGKKSTAVIRPAVLSPPAPISPPVASPVVPVPVQSAPAAAPPAAAAVMPKSTESDADDDSSSRGVRRSKKQIKAQTPLSKQPAQTVQAPADIKLSGIAWQDERAARRAVINGFLLKEGAVVSGARITGIQADRVRFSSPTGLFEIRLDAVLPVEVQR